MTFFYREIYFVPWLDVVLKSAHLSATSDHDPVALLTCLVWGSSDHTMTPHVLPEITIPPCLPPVVPSSIPHSHTPTWDRGIADLVERWLLKPQHKLSRPGRGVRQPRPPRLGPLLPRAMPFFPGQRP
jgi:hypothetical protein